MIRRPQNVYGDPAVVAGTHAALRRADGAAAMPQPGREELRAALTGTVTTAAGTP